LNSINCDTPINKQLNVQKKSKFNGTEEEMNKAFKNLDLYRSNILEQQRTSRMRQDSLYEKVDQAIENINKKEFSNHLDSSNELDPDENIFFFCNEVHMPNHKMKGFIDDEFKTAGNKESLVINIKVPKHEITKLIEGNKLKQNKQSIFTRISKI